MRSSRTCSRWDSRGRAAEGGTVSLRIDFDFLSGLVTVVWFLAFIGLCLWAWSRRRHADYAAAARMPLDETADGCATDRDGSR